MSREPTDSRKTLIELGSALRSLHRSLVKVAQSTYERGGEPINGPAQLLQLLTTHPDFAWLHPLSELMVGIDEVLDEETVSESDKQAILGQLKSLLSQPEGQSPSEFATHYFNAMHSDPAVVIAHSNVRMLLAAN